MKVSWLVCAAGAAICCSGPAAQADVLWETQVRFVVNGAPATNLTVPDGPVDITIQAGIFNLTGLGANQANHGLNMWSGRIASTAAGLEVNQATARIPPYNYGPATSFGGFVTGSGTGIDGSSTPGTAIYAARAIAPTENVPWAFGSPQPTGPNEYGLESFVDVYRFRFNMTVGAGSGTTITATGMGGPVIRWTPLTVQAPDASTPGFVNFLGLSPTPIQRVSTTPILVLNRVPTPGAVPLLGLFVVVSTRRRRR